MLSLAKSPNSLEFIFVTMRDKKASEIISHRPTFSLVDNLRGWTNLHPLIHGEAVAGSVFAHEGNVDDTASENNDYCGSDSSEGMVG